jgi:hypothetical protein
MGQLADQASLADPRLSGQSRRGRSGLKRLLKVTDQPAKLVGTTNQRRSLRSCPKLRLTIVGFCPVYRSFARLGAVWVLAM